MGDRQLEGSLWRVLVFWDNRVLLLLEEKVGTFSVSCQFKSCEDDFCWNFTRVYGSTLKKEREDLWDELGVVQCVLPKLVSDHFPILLDEGEVRRGPMPFRFENMWLKKENFKIRLDFSKVEVNKALALNQVKINGSWLTEENEVRDRVVNEFKLLLSAAGGWRPNITIPVGGVENAEALAVDLGYKVGSLPSTYLGLPLGAPHRSVAVWDGVKERM
ncbi:hypothetical protein CK203_094250 [Vitis vinifera]|uniref:Uncharacterized protein n=1 Tax=Vitis vinifera TaxID=29760 RepID=A0A438DD46_VITVI|nr:hypothetical protein CK203_094250 [Vitis vinifera]